MCSDSSSEFHPITPACSLKGRWSSLYVMWNTLALPFLKEKNQRLFSPSLTDSLQSFSVFKLFHHSSYSFVIETGNFLLNWSHTSFPEERWCGLFSKQLHSFSFNPLIPKEIPLLNLICAQLIKCSSHFFFLLFSLPVNETFSNAFYLFLVVLWLMEFWSELHKCRYSGMTVKWLTDSHASSRCLYLLYRS